MREDTIKKIKFVTAVIFFSIVIAYQVYNILCNTFAYVSSDMASTVLLANEQIKTHQFLPDGFHHSTGVFVLHLNLLIIPFMLFLKDWLLCRELAVIVQTIIGIVCIFILFKKIIKNNNWKYCGAMAVILAMLPMTYNITYFCYYEAVYFLNFIFELVVLIFLINVQNADKFLPAGILYLLAVIGTNLNNTKNIVFLVTPIILALILYAFLESGYNLKKMFCSKKWIYISGITVLGMGIATVIFRLISIRVGLVSATAGNTFAPLDAIGDNILKLINSLLALYGASGKSSLISFSGIMHVVKLLYALISILAVPYFAIKSYKKTENQNIRFMIIFLLISNLLTMYMCIFTTAAGTPRYLISVYFNNILLLVLCTQIFDKFLEYKFTIWCVTGIFAVSVIGVWEIQIHTGDLYGAEQEYQAASSAELIKLLNDNGVKYGYADFNDAYGCMMLSNGEITMAAFTGMDLSPYYWLCSEKWYNEEDYDGRHCILLRNTAKVNESYYITADEIIYYKNYILLVYNENIKDLKDEMEIRFVGESHIDLSSLYVTNMAYRYDDNIYIKSGGKQYGPYIDLKAGKYKIKITGENLKSAVPIVTADDGNETISLNIEEFENDYIIYSFFLDDDKIRVEFSLINNSDKIVKISSIKYAREDEAEEQNQINLKKIEFQDLNVAGEAEKNDVSIELGENSLQYGPYINLPAGSYEVEITGKNLLCGQIAVTASDGQEYIDYEMVETDDSRFIYTFKISENKSRVEFTIRNSYDTILSIYNIGYRKLDE